MDWPSWLVNWALSQVDFIGQHGPWTEPSPESGLKTMIITTFILMLTQVNGQPFLWLGPWPRLITKSGFKNTIITTFIFMLTQVNG